MEDVYIYDAVDITPISRGMSLAKKNPSTSTQSVCLVTQVASWLMNSEQQPTCGHLLCAIKKLVSKQSAHLNVVAQSLSLDT